MKLDDLALLLGKTRSQLEEELNRNDVIELKLTERADKEEIDEGSIKLL